MAGLNTVKEWTVMLNHMEGYMPDSEFDIYKEIIDVLNCTRGFNIHKFNLKVKCDSHIAEMLRDSVTGRWTEADRSYLPVTLLRIANEVKGGCLLMSSTIQVNRICRMCGAHNSVNNVVPKDYLEWQRGKHAQAAFPYLSGTEREQIISGLCPDCQEKLFGFYEEEDDDAI